MTKENLEKAIIINSKIKSLEEKKASLFDEWIDKPENERFNKNKGFPKTIRIVWQYSNDAVGIELPDAIMSEILFIIRRHLNTSIKRLQKEFEEL